MFGPLSFPSINKDPKYFSFGITSTVSICCLCDLRFNLYLQQDDFLQHIFDAHKLVIADVPLIANLEKYISYWRIRLKNHSIKQFCSTILVDVEKDNVILKNQEYFLLSDVLPEDRKLREGLQQQRLEWALEQQKSEREDSTFYRGCLFCLVHITGTRAQYLDHLSAQHNLQLGHPHNLVFIDELIDKLRGKLDMLQCLYCEKVFKDRNVLKEHMRKKLWHKRINPDNKEYDKFYIINYIEPSETFKREQQDNEKHVVSCNEDAEWSDWTEDSGDAIVCLLCPHPTTSWADVNTHLIQEHGFDYAQLTSGLDFYQQVKFVNYIRRQVHRQSCIICDDKFENNACLLDHMKQANHVTLPHCLLWDQPEYFFPTYENDLFLCQIEDSKDAEEELREKMVSLHLAENKEMIEKFQNMLSEP